MRWGFPETSAGAEAPRLPGAGGARVARPGDAAARFRRVNVEITNVCNLRCPFCAASSRPPTVMPTTAFRRLAVELAPLTEEVVLHVLGEPLTHPDLAGLLGAAAEAGLPVHVVTNGVLLDRRRSALLLQPGVRQVSLSLQSAAAALPAGELGPYLERVLAFCDRAASERPDLYVNLRLWNAAGPCTGIADAAMARCLSAHFGRDLSALQVDVRRRKNVPLRGRQYLHFDTRFEWPRLDLPEGSARGTCHGLEGHFGILADGTVVPCCLDADGVLRLGNAFETPLPEILSGDRARRLRAGFAAGRREEALCRRCTFVERFGRRLARMAAVGGLVLGVLAGAVAPAVGAEAPADRRREGPMNADAVGRPGPGPAPHVLPTVRTFMNFGGRPEFAHEWLDLCFRADAKAARRDLRVLNYALVCTLVMPHPDSAQPLTGKARDLAEFCVARGLTRSGILEEMFCHFAEDTPVRLHVGAERADRPVEQRTCPGWDPRNDRNGDGRVDDAEFATRPNPQAGARLPQQARIPIYYWGPPNDDFVMNVGHPAYQEFMATVHAPRVCAGVDGIYFDTVPAEVPGAGRNAAVLEYPRQGAEPGRWRRDLQGLFARIKTNLPEAIIVGNGWIADPMVIDGRQAENWQRLALPAAAWLAALEQAEDLERRGKVQLLQYNPVYDPVLAEFGDRLPVAPDRDRLYGLATYLLVHGRNTYFGFGSHPYRDVEKLCFPALKVDLGEPVDQRRVFAEWGDEAGAAATDVLRNGGFETRAVDGGPEAWTLAVPAAVEDGSGRAGGRALGIRSETARINSICRQLVELKPNTAYTLCAWARTRDVQGEPGAQVYPYEFDGATGLGMLTWTGSADWREQRLTFRTGADGQGRITVRLYGATGTAWFDDVRLLEGAWQRQQVFARRYARGLVLVRPNGGIGFGDETARDFALDGEYRVLAADGHTGAPVRRVTLRNGEAAVLLRP